MRTAPALFLSLVTSAFVTSAASSALAFGGTAGEMERQGNFVIRNNAAFVFSQKVNSPSQTQFILGPAIDYFIINHLSIGGLVEFEFDSVPNGKGGQQSSTVFTIAPDVGYEFTLSDTWSFWPQASLALRFPSDSNAVATLVLFAPFLVHPAEHFFAGIGPGISQDLTSNANTFITGGFVVGGYFDH